MVKSSTTSAPSSLLLASKRTRVELFDLKLFITRPALYYKVQKSKLPKPIKSTKIIKSAKPIKSNKLNKPIKPTTSKVKYNFNKSTPSQQTTQTTTTTTTTNNNNNNTNTITNQQNSSINNNNNTIYLNNSTFNNSGTSYFSGSSAILTTNSTDRIGSVFTKDLVDIEKSFNIEFSYTMETNGTDGVALIIHNNQSTQNPFEFYRLLEGGQLEYNSNSEGGILAIEFKTILNDDIQQPNTNCITVKSSVESINSLTNTIHTYNFTNSISYSNSNNVRISYNSTNSQISLVFNNQCVLNNINIPKLLHKGFIGFVAATGYCIQNQQINNCKITLLN